MTLGHSETEQLRSPGSSTTSTATHRAVLDAAKDDYLGAAEARWEAVRLPAARACANSMAGAIKASGGEL